MRCRWLITGMALMVTAQASVCRAVTDEEVQNAIRKGVQFLYGEQRAWGHWDERQPANDRNADGKQWGGWTAIACYALLSAGEEWQKNDKLYGAIKWLETVETEGTYAVGLRAHVWPKLPDNFLEFVTRDANLLVSGLNANGAYRYTLGISQQDNSCTQYGALGAWECAKRLPGSISNNYWQRLDTYFAGCQNADGGWAYQTAASNLNMTSAGLAVSFITQDYLYSQAFRRPGAAENHPSQQRINRGLAYFDQKFTPNVSRDGYGTVGVERVGLASGYKYFGGRDWYQSIAERVVRDQRGNGAWAGSRGEVVETAFRLIFLSRGRVPVAFNKLKIPDFTWDNRPRDVAKLTDWLANESEKAMNWQVVGIDREAEEWLDAQVLVLASHRPLELTDEQIAKLKRYIDLGGLLLTHSDGSNAAFTESVEAMAAKMYPEYELRVIPREDYVYNITYPVRKPLGLMSVDNGVRHLIIHCPKDIFETFQVDNSRLTENWYTMANIFHYATEVGQARPRLAKHFVKAEKAGSRTVDVARVKYAGNWDPEPGAWIVQRNFMANEKDVAAQVNTVELTELGASTAALAHVVGTNAVTFTDADAQAVRDFVNGGGVMVFEAAGGTQQTLPFADSVKQMLAKAFPGKNLEPVTASATAINGSGVGGFDCSRVDYRVFYKQRVGPTHQPMLTGIMIDGQPRIIVSHEDLSAAMMGQPVWGVFGYDTDSAHQLMTNITLWAAKLRAAAGTAGAGE